MKVRVYTAADKYKTFSLDESWEEALHRAEMGSGSIRVTTDDGARGFIYPGNVAGVAFIDE